jgi:very-short-patch-repair endonuclease
MRGPDRRKVKVERRLRRNSTDAEVWLCLALRDRRLNGFKFVRQEAVDNFIVDFVCREKKLVIELMVVNTRKASATVCGIDLLKKLDTTSSDSGTPTS